MPTVYGVALSPFVRKVRVALMEKKVEHELEPVVPMPPHNATPEFRQMSPIGKVPAYRDGDFAISDSSVILQYLEQTHPSPRLYPANAQDRARALWLEELADSKLVENVGPVFFNRIVKPSLMNQEPDQDAIDAALEALPPLFDYLEGQLGDGDFLVGEHFSVADIATGSVLRQYQIAGETVDASRWPKLAAYTERILSRESFQTAAKAETMGPPPA